ncbi:techylectin-5B-like [Amphibalanus amphitrite]|uniref:techylectin-5B-like n=1 Tax=Amphibalanus amphitrite TaxID=1232801 RepID=UPI001C90DABE|nr:techylectin-5B-like [Amphibalanus amphitrite]
MKLPLGLPVVLYVLQLLVCTAHLATVLTSGPTSGTYGTSGLSSIMRDCSDLPQGTTSGVYTIMVDLQNPTPAYCDMDDGEGWTVFQRRADILPRQDFYLDWQAYKWGLGSFAEEFWWGLHPLWQLTSQSDRTYELRVDLRDWDEQTAYATYQDFTIASEADNYRIAFTDYAGDAGDSLGWHKGMMFSTFDRDNDNDPDHDCAHDRQGAWWYNACTDSNLNGLYRPDLSDWRTITWYDWRGKNYSNKATTMKIRPSRIP